MLSNLFTLFPDYACLQALLGMRSIDRYVFFNLRCDNNIKQANDRAASHESVPVHLMHLT